MHWFKLHIGDYAQATAHLTWLEDAAYFRCLRKYYSDHGLPADLGVVQRLVGARSKQEKEAVERVINEFFFVDGNFYRNKRAEEEIVKANDKSLKAKGSANTRWMRTHSESTADAERTMSEGNAIQEPRSNNQEPRTKKKRDISIVQKPEDLDDQVWEDYLQARKAPLTQTAYKLICNEASRAGISPAEAIRFSAEHGWRGFKAEWYEKANPKATVDEFGNPSWN
jgi:uncharacterized protein YdaU (DUF1376 family)